ncbi:MAG: nucleotide sugar dehydrogenase [Fimbriimonadaceae bacterium]|nr:nucleotide sugar dehydrogenase [Fimbriimonadaceae bacterium]
MPAEGEMGMDALIARIADRSAKVGVVGLGYVGLPLAVEAANEGFHVTGIDLSQSKCDAVNAGSSYIKDLSDEHLAEVVHAGRLRAVATFEAVAELDVIVIAVPTPLDDHLIPDMSYVTSASESIGKYLKAGQLVSLESTTYPGTTKEVIQPMLERMSGMKAEQDFYLAHSPERVDPGNTKYQTKNTPKVVGGLGPNSHQVASAFYAAVVDTVVPVSSAEAAELTKVFENTFRAVNIALVNELLMLCDRMGIDVWEVLDAANTKPFGIMRFMPGPGVGGHCIPLDPHYLEWKARAFNFRARFIELAGEINRAMPLFVRDKALRMLNEIGKPLKGSKIVVLGVAYKRDIDDWRESPSIHVLELLEHAGSDVVYHDPFVPDFTEKGHTRHSVALTDELLTSSDLVVITTPHSNVDYDRVVALAPAVLDTRDVTRHMDLTGKMVVRL